MNHPDPTASHDQCIVAAGTDGRGLQVRFHWSGDRFAHRITPLITDAQAAASETRLDSVEGDGEQNWPPSAPLQQLSIETIQDAPAALAVGSAGQSHWSCSVAAVDRPDQRPALRFDFAVRVAPGATAPTPQSSYLAIDSGKSGDSIAANFQIEAANQVAPAQVHYQDGIWRIEPAEKSGRTLRWAYEVTLADARG